MTRVLVTGGTGTLGDPLVSLLAEAGYAVRVMSRQSAPQSLDSAHEWAQADLGSGDGLAEAVADVDVVVHAATSPQQSKVVACRDRTVS